MDQLKPYLEGLKKYHFWLLCVVIVGASYFAWNSGAKTLDEQFQSNRSQINGAFDQAEGVKRHRPHPNNTFITAANSSYDQLAAELQAAWQARYDRQKAVFVWPGAPLRDDFAPTVSALTADADIPDAFKSNYQNEAKNIPATWIPKYNLRRVVSGDGRAAVLGGVLIWNDIPRLEDRYTFAALPTTKQIRIAQEDFWLYEVLLGAIAKLNEGRETHHDAIVKQIVALNFAQQALIIPQPTVPTVSTKQEVPKEIKVPPANAPDAELVAFRYCDAAGKPIAAPTGKEEYVLVPVQMVLIMDQRHIPNLLVSLANAPLLFDTTIMTFTDGDVMSIDTSAKQGSGGGGGGGGAAAGGNAAAGAGPGGRGQPADKKTMAFTAEPGPYDCRVEIRGNLYLFNPPDATRLQPKAAKPGGPAVASS